MRAKLLVLMALVAFSACSLIFTPKATVKTFMAAAEKGDIDKMTQMYSRNALDVIGADKIRLQNQSLAELTQLGANAGGAYRMENVEQTPDSTGQVVAFVYKNNAATIKLEFHLSEEGSGWKIDTVGGPELDAMLGTGSPEAVTQTIQVPAISSPELIPSPPAKSEFKGTTVSGGVLNGKATSLPKPPSPPIAKAAKAGGTVVVQVLVDENGNVISASPVSGHPLLQAAAVAAARNAKFSPTILSGKPVRVTGVITYSFTPE